MKYGLQLIELALKDKRKKKKKKKGLLSILLKTKDG
jgi:hypothetical protein